MADDTNLLTLTTDIISSYTGSNSVPTSEVPALIKSVHAALSGLGSPAPATTPDQSGPTPATTKRKSLANPNVIISMIDGKPYSILARHIRRHGYTPQSYREAFGLPADYPMTAPAYSERRRDLAHKIGLGRRPAAVIKAEPSKAVVDPKPAKSMRKPRSLKAALGKAKEHLGGSA